MRTEEKSDILHKTACPDLRQHSLWICMTICVNFTVTIRFFTFFKLADVLVICIRLKRFLLKQGVLRIYIFMQFRISIVGK